MSTIFLMKVFKRGWKNKCAGARETEDRFFLALSTWTIRYRKIPIIGKHSRKITCGAWSNQNLLALGSDDKSITISNAEGDTLRQTSTRAEPSDVQFSEMKGDERSAMGENTVWLAYFSIFSTKYILVNYWKLLRKQPIAISYFHRSLGSMYVKM